MSTARPICVASTSANNNADVADAPGQTQQQSAPKPFHKAEFSGDGTTIVAHSESKSLKTFILPIDLLDDASGLKALSPYCVSWAPSNIQSYALYPNFDLQDSSTTVALSAARDVPIRLLNVLHTDTVHATYPLINPTTEAYIAPSSITWTHDRGHFITGTTNQISVFDSRYDGSGPLLQHKTAPGKAERKQYGKSALNTCSGIISALSISPDRFLAAGSLQREVALYANEGSGECVTSFSLTAHVGQDDGPAGRGITQLAWTPCGTYLFVAERQSDCIQVFDVRNTLGRVCWLSGRKAQTAQRLSTNILPTVNSCEAWAGGADGCVRVWRDPYTSAGERAPDDMFQLHDGLVSSAVWHPAGAVLATCSGSRSYGLGSTYDQRKNASSLNENEDEPLDNTLKIWTF